MGARVRSAEELVPWIVERSFEKTGRDLLVELEPRLRRLSVEWELGSGYAVLREAEAVTVPDESGVTICFASSTPTRSAVLEELAHVAQWRGAPAPEDDILLVLYRREVEAKQCLVEKADILKIPSSETLETLYQLEQCRRALAGRERLFV